MKTIIVSIPEKIGEIQNSLQNSSYKIKNFSPEIHIYELIRLIIAGLLLLLVYSCTRRLDTKSRLRQN